MIRLAAALLILPTLAFADPVPAIPDDRPLMFPVQGGTVDMGEKNAPQVVTIPHGYFVNDPGYEKLTQAFTKLSTDSARLTAENASLKKLTEEKLAEPVISIKTAAIAVGLALLVGAATAFKLTH